jgi:23S rRNA (uridine2552-2'-O)-methyltransferase
MTKKSKNSPPRIEAVRLKKKKGRKLSSKLWLERQLNDPYVVQARKLGYRSRAAFKLKELNEELKFLKKKCRVVDLGAAPGGWTQVILEEVDTTHPTSQVIALDILPMEEILGALVLQMDFSLPEAPDLLKQHLKGPVDVVLSDMAPASTGHRQTDHIRIISLTEMALDFAIQVLAPGGIFIAKVWQGGTTGELLKLLKESFDHVSHIKPPASRKESAEVYVVARGFKEKINL